MSTTSAVTACASLISSRLLTSLLQGLEPTSRTSIAVHLSPDTATQPDDFLPVEDPINITFVYPKEGQQTQPALPYGFMLAQYT